MEIDPKKKVRKWYQKKRYLIPLSFVGILAIIGGAGNSTQTSTLNTPSSSQVQSGNTTYLPVSSVQTPVSKPVSTTPVLSNDNYYTNVNGTRVHSPAYSNSIPADATARCRDGTYSFSQNRRGTCSHHGGVSEWLN